MDNSCLVASAHSPSSTTRQRQIKVRATPASAGLGQLADELWLAGHTGLVFHTGISWVSFVTYPSYTVVWSLLYGAAEVCW